MSDLARFARRLLEHLEAGSPGASAAAAVPLAEIPGRVMPYAACRRALGILSIEDYEHLLLRLVAGEGGMARAQPTDAVDRCRAELDTGHPDLAVLRSLEGVVLQFNPRAIEQAAAREGGVGDGLVRPYELHGEEVDAPVPAQTAAGPGALRVGPAPPPAPEREPTPAPPVVAQDDLPALEAEVPAPRAEPYAAMPLIEPEFEDPVSAAEADIPSDLDTDVPGADARDAEERLELPVEAPSPKAADIPPARGMTEEPVEAVEEEPSLGELAETAEEEPLVADTVDATAASQVEAAHEPEQEDPFQELLEVVAEQLEQVGGGSEAPTVEIPEPAGEGAGERGTPASAEAAPPIPPARPVHGEPPPRCPHCASRLPTGRPIRFCPHCGSGVVPLECGRCGADLEPAWRHCVLCGAPVMHDSRFA